MFTSLMTDLSEIKSVYHTTSVPELNFYLERGGMLLAIAPGNQEDGTPCIRYSIGFTVFQSGQPQKPQADYWHFPFQTSSLPVTESV